ncbi:hypothetical protein ACT453_25175, partial [Bacillus sp. D-CC]
MSKKKKSRVLVAGVCLATLLTPYGLELPKVYAEMAVEDKEKQTPATNTLLFFFFDIICVPCSFI